MLSVLIARVLFLIPLYTALTHLSGEGEDLIGYNGGSSPEHQQRKRCKNDKAPDHLRSHLRSGWYLDRHGDREQYWGHHSSHYYYGDPLAARLSGAAVSEASDTLSPIACATDATAKDRAETLNEEPFDGLQRSQSIVDLKTEYADFTDGATSTVRRVVVVDLYHWK